MPSKLTSKPSTRPLPPGRRTNNYQLPHSPFQKMVEAARVSKGLSWQDLGEEVGKDKSVVWAWIHSKNGYPSKASCQPEHLKRLAAALGLDLGDVKKSIDTSRMIFSPQENPVPRDVVDSWSALEATLLLVGKKRVQTSWVIDLVRRLKPKSDSADPDIARPAKRNAGK